MYCSVPRLFVYLLLVGAGLFGFVCNAVAAYAQNAYVSVICDEALGVYAVNSGFYVLCPSETTGSLHVRVVALDPFRLDMPDTGFAEVAPGGSCSYCVSDESGSEDSYSGVIRVLKLAIKPDETNVCWKASQCTLRLTSDSNPGGKTYWTSRPTGINGTGRSVTFNPQNLSPGGYIVTACSEIFPSYSDQALVNVVKVTELLHRIGQAMAWSQFKRPQKMLFGRNVRVKAFTIPEYLANNEVIIWDGTYGMTGSGKEIVYQYHGVPSVSDGDVKTVFTNCGPEFPKEFLVCAKVIGIHSNASSEDSLTYGHAWLTVTRYESGTPITTSYGLWGNRARTKEGSDVHIGLEGPSGKFNRYFLLSPSQYSELVKFLDADCEWHYRYTCANWAGDGYRTATGETVSSSEFVLFGTPRAIGESIKALEGSMPTQRDIPYDGGEKAPTSSSGLDSSWSGSSFPLNGEYGNE